MRRLFKTILILLLLSILCSPLLLLFAISDSKALVEHSPEVTPAVARSVQQKAKEMQFSLYYLRYHTTSFSEQEIANLFAVAGRALPQLRGAARIGNSGSEIRMTLHVPQNPFGDYINLRLRLPPRSQGLEIESLAIGNITLPAHLALPLIEALANRAFGDNEGTALLRTIKQILSHNGRLFISYQPTPHIDEKVIAALSRLNRWNGAEKRNDSAAIRYYYSELCGTPHQTPSVPLAEQLNSVMKSAARRGNTAQETADENRAALLALAIFQGSERFNAVLHAIDFNDLRRCQRRAPVATLAGRKDLALHFLYSAAIKSLANSQTSFAIGELKEMMDSLQGGSGFSFADLTADESGIRFAEVATSESTARRLHAIDLSDEDNLLPTIQGLPEGLPQRQFEAQYGGSNSERYNRMLDEIRARIERLALYRQ